MKKITILLVMTFMSLSMVAQNFVATKKSRQAFTDTTTSYTYQIEAKKYPVFKSKNKAFYIWKVSKKSGKTYKYYLPKDVQIKMGRTYKTEEK